MRKITYTMKDYSKMSDDEFFRQEQKQRMVPFPPEENEFMEIHRGSTPLGGDLSIAYFFDRNDQHCTRENMAYMNILIYDNDGTFVNAVYGKNPYK